MRLRRSLSLLLPLLLVSGAAGLVAACNTAELLPEGPIMPAEDLNLDAGDDDASDAASTGPSTTTTPDAAGSTDAATANDDASDGG